MGFRILNNREFFNSMAEKWDSIVNHDERKIKSILDMVQIKEGSKVLDVGTGTGVMIPFLHPYTVNNGRIIAVDEAEKMIDVAKKKCSYENVEFVTGDVLEIELMEDYFDCIMCYSMFPHFIDKKAAIERLARYLKKDGKFVICHSESREIINNLHKKVSEVVKDDQLPPVDIIREYYSKAAIRTISVVDNEDMFVVIGEKE